MAITSFPFISVSGDRKITAASFAKGVKVNCQFKCNTLQ
jgi:hypothetical protein